METITHTDTVLAMYEAFGRGDIPAVLAQLDPAVTWDVTEEPWSPQAAGVPWLMPRRGHAEVSGFFAIVGQWEYERFEPLDLLVSERQVAAVVRLIARLPNGNRIDQTVIHLWTFGDDGRVVALRRMLDTAAEIAAAG